MIVVIFFTIVVIILPKLQLLKMEWKYVMECWMMYLYDDVMMMSWKADLANI